VHFLSADLIKELLNRLFLKRKEMALKRGYCRKRMTRIVNEEAKQIKKDMQKKVHGICLDRWSRRIQEAVKQQNEMREEFDEEGDLLPSPNMGSLRKTIIHWINGELDPFFNCTCTLVVTIHSSCRNLASRIEGEGEGEGEGRRRKM
jgi:hypothetical protein